MARQGRGVLLMCLTLERCMKILFIHNAYYRFSGEEQSSSALARLLEEHGHEIAWYRRGSNELDQMKLGKLRAAFTSLHNPGAVHEVQKLIGVFQPDIVQAQNLYPLISPSVLPAIQRMGVPVIMRCPNYRLFCPNGLFLEPGGQVCERCAGAGREIWCLIKNCERDRLKSAAYALRNAAARLRGVFLKHVELFIVQSEFQRQKFIDLGIPAQQLAILPGILPAVTLPTTPNRGDEVTFVGRVSPEKGIHLFIEAARLLPDIPFAVAGGHPEDLGIQDYPVNLQWKGFLNEEQLNQQYLKSRFIVVPSQCYEGFPNVILRAMALEKPVITSKIGGLQDIVIHGVTGLHVPPGSANELARAIATLYADAAQCVRMGQAARPIACERYGRDAIYQTLLAIYQQAIQQHSMRPAL